MSKYLHISRWVGRLLLLLAIAVGLTGRLQAQESAWSPPMELTTPLSDWDWFPDVAVDAQGDVHLIWQTAQCSPKYQKPCLMYWRQRGGVWQPAYDVFLDQGAGQSAIRAAIATDNVGCLHLVYVKDAQSIVYQQVWIDQADSARAWSEPRRLSGFGHSYFPDVAVGPDGVLHAVWTESAGNKPSEDCKYGDCSDIFYRRSTDAGIHWSPSVNLSRSDVGTMKVHVRTDARGWVHVFWEEGGDRFVSDRLVGVAYAVSYDGGQIWSKPQIFTHPNGIPRQIMLDVDGRGRIVAVWRLMPENTPYYQVSPDGERWSAPQPVPGLWSMASTAVFDVYDMASDSRGILHLVAAGRRSPTDQQAIFHLAWDGQSWSAPEQISPSGGYPEFPRIAIGGGNRLHVVWYTKEWPGYEEGQEMRTWYSTCQISAPAQTPPPWPTLTPTALPTPSPTPFPTSTPFPTIAPGSGRPFDPGALYTEHDEVAGLLVAIAPVLFILLMVLAVRLEWIKSLAGRRNR